jgi:predicted DCC family thiol-disulfide oxidoreductase YuxK
MTARIVVFDGECALCNGFVAWLITHDQDARFLIAGSAGEVGRSVIGAAGLPPHITASTIVLWDGDRALLRSDAVLAILAQLPWPWKLAQAGRLVPSGLRDRIYRFIAARRPRVEADNPACGVPPPEIANLWRSRLATARDLPSARWGSSH